MLRASAVARVAATRRRPAVEGCLARRRVASRASRADDERVMRRAIALARDAGARGEVPVGAVLVERDTGRVVAEAVNACEADGDPTAHAELRCARAGAAALGNWRHLRRTTMYVTLEPCAMCAGGLLQSRVGRVVYGARNPLLGGDGSWVNVLRGGGGGEDGSATRPHAFSPDVEVVGGVLAEETGALMTDFFKRRRTLPEWSAPKER